MSDSWNASPAVSYPPSAPAASPLAPEGGAPPWLTKYAGQMEGLAGQDQATMQAKQSALDPRYQRLEKTLEQPLPSPPQQQKVADAPDPKQYRANAMEFASAMAVLGAIGSKFARVPATAALSAFAGAMNGFQQGNLESYQQAQQQWDANTKKTIDNNKMVLDKYKQVLENRKLNIDQQMSEIQLIAAQYQDKITYDAAAAKNYTMVANVYEKLDTYNSKLSDARSKLVQDHDKEMRKVETTKNYWISPEGTQRYQSLTPEQKQGVDKLVSGVGSLSDETLQEMAGQYLAGDKSVFQNLGRGAQGSENISKLRQIITDQMNAQGISPSEQAMKVAEFAGLTAGERTLGTRTANVELAVNEANNMLGIAREESSKVPRGKWVPVNRAIQAYKSGTSDPALAQFAAANLAVINTYSRAISPNGVPTVHDKEHAEQVLSTAMGPASYNAVLDQLEKEMEAARKSPGQVRQEFRTGTTGGKPAKDQPSPKTEDYSILSDDELKSKLGIK